MRSLTTMRKMAPLLRRLRLFCIVRDALFSYSVFPIPHLDDCGITLQGLEPLETTSLNFPRTDQLPGTFQNSTFFPIPHLELETTNLNLLFCFYNSTFGIRKKWYHHEFPINLEGDDDFGTKIKAWNHKKITHGIKDRVLQK